MKTKSTKTCFVSLQIRELTKEERKALDVVRDVLCGRVQRDVIGKIPACLSIDGKDRPLVLDKYIVDKIRRDHGNIVAENLIVNVYDWDFGIKNVDRKQNRINLVKVISGSNNYLVLAANRENGFYIVTHYEVVSDKRNNRLKNLLNRGSLLDRSGVPSGAPATSPIKLEKVSSDNDAELLANNDSKSESNVKNKKVYKLKRLLKRGNVLDHCRRGVPSEAPEAPLVPSMKPEKVSGDIDTKLLAKEYSKSESKVKSKDVDI